MDIAKFKFLALATFLFSFLTGSAILLPVASPISFPALGQLAQVSGGTQVTITPLATAEPLRNPYKGFGMWGQPRQDPLGTVYIVRTPWVTFEQSANDTVTRIRNWLTSHMRNCSDCSIKLRLNPHDAHPDELVDSTVFPADLPVAEYIAQSPYFHSRLTNLINKMGQVFSGDPRVAVHEIGFVGRWGEEHTPSPTAQTQQVITSALKTYWPNSFHLRRTTDKYNDPTFSLFNDSFVTGGGYYEDKRFSSQRANSWKARPISGEIAFGAWTSSASNARYPRTGTWEDWKKNLFKYEDDCRLVINAIQFAHYSHLNLDYHYDMSPQETQCMYDIHKILGYRFEVSEFKYSAQIARGSATPISFKVINTGAAPFYYNWPVEVSLLNPNTKQPVWRTKLSSVDVRQWVGGENFPEDTSGNTVMSQYRAALLSYAKPAPTYTIAENITIPTSVPAGEYIIALSITNPNGQPTVRFATKNYFSTGWHPMGYIAVDTASTRTAISSALFDPLSASLPAGTTLGSGSSGGTTTPPPVTGTLCNSYGNTSTPPSQFGASYNLFSAAKELLLSVVCDTSSATFTIGNGQTTTYIWSQAYYTKNGQTWNPITLAGTNTVGNGQWIIGSANSTQALTSQEIATQNYLASYVCTYVNNAWKCGCSDTTCATPKWNLQGFRK